MKRNPFSPSHFVKPDIEEEMVKMHTNTYIEQLDYSEDEEPMGEPESSVHTDNLSSLYESYSVSDQTILHEIERGSFAHLNELTVLPDFVAKQISQKLSFLNLAGIVDLTAEAAHFLGMHEGRLFLCGITSFHPGVAQELGHHEGFLDLARLETLSLEDAQALSQQKGDLRLSGLRLNFDAPHTVESEKILRALASHQGEILFSSELQSRFEICKGEQKFKKAI